MELDTGSYYLSAHVLDDDINAEVLSFEFDVAVFYDYIDLLEVRVLDVDRIAALSEIVRNIDDLCLIFGCLVDFIGLDRDLQWFDRLPLVTVLVEDLDVVSSDNLHSAYLDFDTLCCDPDVGR